MASISRTVARARSAAWLRSAVGSPSRKRSTVRQQWPARARAGSPAAEAAAMSSSARARRWAACSGASRAWWASDRASASTVRSPSCRARSTAASTGSTGAPAVGVLGGEAGFEAQTQATRRCGVIGGQPAERPALDAEDPIGFGRRAVLVHPQPAEADGGVGEGQGVAGGLGGGRGVVEQGPGGGQAAVGEGGTHPREERGVIARAGPGGRHRRQITDRDRHGFTVNQSRPRAPAGRR